MSCKNSAMIIIDGDDDDDDDEELCQKLKSLFLLDEGSLLSVTASRSRAGLVTHRKRFQPVERLLEEQ